MNWLLYDHISFVSLLHETVIDKKSKVETFFLPIGTSRIVLKSRGKQELKPKHSRCESISWEHAKLIIIIPFMQHLLHTSKSGCFHGRRIVGVGKDAQSLRLPNMAKVLSG